MNYPGSAVLLQQHNTEMINMKTWTHKIIFGMHCVWVALLGGVTLLE